MKSPIAGIVASQKARVGTITTANQILISVISDNLLKIETYIPEVDIAKVSLGDSAEVTLDAYNDEVFMAHVVSFDPAETVIEGVPTYKVELLFDEESSLIRSGMTANIDILTEEKYEVLAVPVRAVITVDTIKYLRIVNSVNQVENIPIVTGLRGSEGYIEIIDGIEESDRVVTFMRD